MALLHCELDSKSVRMPTSVMAILPHDVISTSQSPKVLYLLHGCSHNYSVWSRYTSLERYCLPYNLAVIMPEVNRSFYTDMAYGPEYFTYITEELNPCFTLVPVPKTVTSLACLWEDMAV